MLMLNRSSFNAIDLEKSFPEFHFVLSSAKAKMKTELCNFSGLKIHPGHGRRYARIDGKVFNFLNGKCKASFMMKRNPRRVNWTVLYRRKNKKGSQEEITKKRTRRTTKYQRAIGGASLADIMAKRNQKPEARKAQREQAVKAAKEKTKAKKALKKASAPAKTRAGTKSKAQQKVKTATPRVGGKR